MYQNGDIVQEIKFTCLRWFGDIEGHPEKVESPSLICNENAAEKKPLARPRLRWQDNILSIIRRHIQWDTLSVKK